MERMSAVDLKERAISALVLLWVVSIPVSTAATNICFFLLMLVSLFYWRKDTWLQGWLGPCLISIFVFNIIALLWSGATNHEKTSAMIDCLRLLGILLLAPLFTAHRISLLRHAFILTCIVVVLLGILKVLGLPIGGKYFGGAIFKNHITTSFLVATAAFMLANQLLYTEHKRWVGLGLGLMSIYMIFFNSGRLGFILFLIYMLMFARQWFQLNGASWVSLRKIAIVLLAVLVILPFLGVSLLSLPLLKRFAHLEGEWSLYQQNRNLELSSVGSRILFIEKSVALIHKKPLLGWGTGSFGSAYQNEFPNDFYTSNPHNEWLRVGVELGIFGIALYGWLFILLWRRISHALCEQQLMYYGFLFVFLLGTVSNSWLMDFTEMNLFCFICTMLVGQTISKRRTCQQLYQSHLSLSS